ncbi:hypothetical protein EMCG_09695 [[Emmonsia] crescens]|uniref:Uncharacterized protein n=1 Tax=[Emmonsia] crescens TaxID=73230 RepID=A0A0G2J9N9_9EURO|nr:hypothetical protein EMCG_09695 [Emmonsia crescens UAMH 3008]
MNSEEATSEKSAGGQKGQKRKAKLEEETRTSSRGLKRACKEEQPSEPAKTPRAGSKLALENDLQNARNIIGTLQNKCYRLDQEILSLKKQHKEFEKEVLGLREARGVERMDDGEIRTLFDNLMRRYRAWAQEYSPQGAVDLSAFEDHKLPTDEEENNMMHAILSGVYSSLEVLRYGKYIFLNTLLIHFACWFVIDNPLFFLQREFSDRRFGYPQEFLSELSQALPEHRKDEWIGCTLRMLLPNRQDHCHTNFVANNRIIGQITNFYERLARRFLAIAAPLLKPLSVGVTGDRFQSLVTIIATTGELVLRLRQQNYNVKSLSHDSSTFRNNCFSRESQIMEPHSAMRLRPDDSSLDGSEIDFVIQPAILAYWFDEDSREKREKFWTKAVVWANGLEQINARRADNGHRVGVMGVKGEPGFTQQDGSNSARELPTPTENPHSVNDTLPSLSSHTMVSLSGMVGLQVPSAAVALYSNESCEMPVNDPEGLDTQGSSVETHPDPSRLDQTSHPKAIKEEAVDHPVGMKDRILSNGSEIRPICNNAEDWTESSRSDSKPNDNELGYTSQERIESDDELAVGIPFREANKSKKEKSQFAKEVGYMRDTTCQNLH